MLFYTKKRGLISSKRPLFIANFLFSAEPIWGLEPQTYAYDALLYQLS